MNAQRVLPAKVYDALAMSAAMYGGIGPFWYGVGVGNRRYVRPESTVPICYSGHLLCSGVVTLAQMQLHAPTMNTAMYGISELENDEAVCSINARRRRDERTRVSFEEWCAELNVVRGPEEPAERAVAAQAHQSSAVAPPDSAVEVFR